MKTALRITVLLFCVAALFVQGKMIKKNVGEDDDSATLKYPKKVKEVIDSRCYGCHSPEGKSDKAKKKLMWDDLPGMSKSDAVAKLDDIIEVLEKGKMPPEKFLAMKPDAKPTEKEVKILKDWADKTADHLMK